MYNYTNTTNYHTHNVLFIFFIHYILHSVNYAYTQHISNIQLQFSTKFTESLTVHTFGM